jgi:hypothetical protein
MLTATRLSTAAGLFVTAIAMGVTADLLGTASRRVGSLAKALS